MMINDTEKPKVPGVPQVGYARNEPVSVELAPDI